MNFFFLVESVQNGSRWWCLCECRVPSADFGWNYRVDLDVSRSLSEVRHQIHHNLWLILKLFFFLLFRTIRYICSCLQRKVMSRWPQERLVRTRVVSGFIFLRLLCPAILNPRNFNLIAETPSHNASRSLIMVAKCLQNLANLVEFGGKEPYMEVVNPFILKNKERMVYYLDQLSVRFFT